MYGEVGISGLLTHSTDVTKTADPDIAFLFLPRQCADLIRRFSCDLHLPFAAD
jgi:hypothetical protein